MAKKISDLADATTPLAGTELVEIVQSGVSKKVSASNLASGGSSGTIDGNLTIIGAARRIVADFTNAVIGNRAMFQTSTADSKTSVGVIPNGTGNESAINLFGSSDPGNSSYAQLGVINDAEVRLASYATGTGTSRPITFYLGGVEIARIDNNGFFNFSKSDGTNQADITATTYGVNGGGILHGRYARGTMAAPSAVLAGDIFAGVGGRAYHSGGAFHPSSPTSIHWVAAEDQTATAYGSYLRLLTTPKGSTTRQERMILAHHGGVWVHNPSASWDAKNDTHTSPLMTVGQAQVTVSATGLGETAQHCAVSYGTTAGAGFRAGVAGGTIAAPSATAADTMICFLGGHGYGSSGWVPGSKGLFAIYAAENWTASASGAYATIGTTPKGSTTRQERVRVKPAGQVKFVPMASAPTVDVEAGDVYYDSTTNKLRCYNGSTWNDLF